MANGDRVIHGLTGLHKAAGCGDCFVDLKLGFNNVHLGGGDSLPASAESQLRLIGSFCAGAIDRNVAHPGRHQKFDLITGRGYIRSLSGHRAKIEGDAVIDSITIAVSQTGCAKGGSDEVAANTNHARRNSLEPALKCERQVIRYLEIGCHCFRRGNDDPIRHLLTNHQVSLCWIVEAG